MSNEPKPQVLAPKVMVYLLVGSVALSAGAAVLSVGAVVFVSSFAGHGDCHHGGAGPTIAAAETTGVSPHGAARIASQPNPAMVGTIDDVPHPGQSVGSPRGGSLFGGERLESAEGYVVRNPDRSWATRSTIFHLKTAIARVRERFPELHRLAIGDLAAEVGGPIGGHLSHQSGRDVDLGFYYRKKPARYPRRFVDATRDNIHYRGTLALIRALAETTNEPTGVEWIILDYDVQKLLVEWARRHGVEDERLAEWFQYPHGPSARRGLVRHYPGHKNHLHVRFKCQPDDPHCKSPIMGPGSFDNL